mmetsp:Transcript_27827/g.88375  ORF Transcript_27827/g.88375 Transcript_27827/m.88375 type:complete len:400 (-) Transcript_27827:2531-3730(-)
MPATLLLPAAPIPTWPRRSASQPPLATPERKKKTRIPLSRANLKKIAEGKEYECNEGDCRRWIGFDSIFLALHLWSAWAAIFQAKTEFRRVGEIRFKGGGLGNESGPLSTEEEILLTCMVLRKGDGIQVAADFFGIRHQQASVIVDRWMPRCCIVGKHLSIFGHQSWFRKTVDLMMPDEYKKGGYENMVALVDGSDIATESCRTSFQVKQAKHSSKLHHDAVRGLTWTTPCGTSASQTDLFLAKVSEVRLYQDGVKAGLLDYLKAGDVVAGDKGFVTCRLLNPRLQEMRCPAHLGRSKRKYFSYDQCLESKELCRLRYTAETFFERVKTWGYLHDTAKHEKLRHINSAWHWAHGMGNTLFDPLRQFAPPSVEHAPPLDDDDDARAEERPTKPSKRLRRG